MVQRTPSALESHCSRVVFKVGSSKEHLPSPVVLVKLGVIANDIGRAILFSIYGALVFAMGCESDTLDGCNLSSAVYHEVLLLTFY